MDKFTASGYNRETRGLAAVEDTLYLVPVGDVQGAILHPLCAGVEEVLGIPTQVAPALPHPSYAYSMERDQYLSTSILEQLAQVDQPNTFRVLGVVDLDLYVPQLNFVFGQAATGGREALVALPRLRQSFYGMPEDLRLFHHRTLKEALHELGHTFGLGHCPMRNCVMFFSNSLRDTDTKGTNLCPSCARSLEQQS